jgi:hypothetical protein
MWLLLHSQSGLSLTNNNMAEGQEEINKTDIEWIKQTLSEIKEQTIKTNGRVTALEAFKIQAVTYGSLALIAVPIILNRIL